jgi:hypothetical protein
MNTARAARRRMPCFSLCAALVVLAVTPRAASAETARSADAFVDSVGVNTHVIYDDTAYHDFASVRARLQELGIRHIRDGICGTCGWQFTRYQALASDGIKLDALMADPRKDATARAQNVSEVKRLGSMIASVEGANEWDNSGSPTWVADDRAYQQWVWNTIHADPALSRIPVIGPSLVFSWTNPTSWTKLGDLSSFLDYGNMHPYAGGRPPEGALDAELARAHQISAAKPVIATEAGYHNALNQANQGHPAVSEDAAGAYMPRMYLENFRRGVPRTFDYELLDERPGRALVDQEQSFGLLRSDFSRKPAYVAVRNLIALLTDPGPVVADREVSLRVTSTAGDLRRLVLVKRSGEINVVLWRAASLWDTATRTPRSVPPVDVTVQPGAGVPSGPVSLFQPAVSVTPTSVQATAGAVRVPVGAIPVVLRFAQAPPTPITPPAPGPAPSSSLPPVPQPQNAPAQPKAKTKHKRCARHKAHRRCARHAKRKRCARHKGHRRCARHKSTG